MLISFHNPLSKKKEKWIFQSSNSRGLISFDICTHLVSRVGLFFCSSKNHSSGCKISWPILSKTFFLLQVLILIFFFGKPNSSFQILFSIFLKSLSLWLVVIFHFFGQLFFLQNFIAANTMLKSSIIFFSLVRKSYEE